MTIQDIMIGDWVFFPEINRHVVVTTIYDNGMITVTDQVTPSLANRYMRTCDKFEPILLTAEILEKNGFESVLAEDDTECYHYFNSAADGYIKISLYNGGDGDWSIKIVNYKKFDDNEIAYSNNFIFLKVYELQHALKLCGIKKQIELSATHE